VKPVKLLRKLKPFPAVARKLLDIISDDAVRIPAVAELVKSDTAFAGEILRLANSAAMGLRYEVVSIMHALTLLGMDRLRALVLTVALRDCLPTSFGDELIRKCWRHNFASALVAEWLAGLCWLDKSEGYTAGLMHDVGQMALVTLYPAEYRRIALRPLRGVAEVLAAEKRAFGMNHCETGSWIAEHWGMPASLQAVMSHADTAGGFDGTVTMPRLATMACRVASNLGFAVADADLCHNVDYLRDSLPADVWRHAGPHLDDSLSRVAFKLNAFESEFLS
jgi:HD-like signal output (HDOD) protein